MGTNSRLSPEQIKELEDQLNILNESQKYLLYLISSIILSYGNIDTEKQRIIDRLNNINITSSENSSIDDRIFQRRMVASALVIEAATFSFNLSKEDSETNSENPIQDNSNKINHFLDGLALFIIYGRTIDNVITHKNNIETPENIN